MSYEMALRKAGLPIVRSFLHSIEGVQSAFPIASQKRNRIIFKLKHYKDGKLLKSQNIQTLEEAFPAKGDVK